MTVIYKSPVPPHRRPTPRRCVVLGRRLARVVAQFKRRGIRVPNASRLIQEANALSKVGADNAFPKGKPQRRIVANGIRDVLEFQEIGKLAGTNEAFTLAADLNAALKGTPHRQERERKPYQFQSQLWVGSVFLASPVRPTVVPSGKIRAPDFLLDVEGRTYGLEVKRPTRGERLREEITRARDQLAEQKLRGGVAVDVSDCLPDNLVFAQEGDSDKEPGLPVAEDFNRLYKACGEIVFDSQRRSHTTGFSRIVFLIVYFNGWRWVTRGRLGPEMFGATQIGRFVTAKGNLPYWDAERIRSAYFAGLRKTGTYVYREINPPR